MKGLPDEIFDDKKTIFGTSTLKQKRLALGLAPVLRVFQRLLYPLHCMMVQFEQY
jgi:hypothetical protein